VLLIDLLPERGQPKGEGGLERKRCRPVPVQRNINSAFPHDITIGVFNYLSMI